MRREPIDAKDAAERTVRDIRRRTRKQPSSIQPKRRSVSFWRGFVARNRSRPCAGARELPRASTTNWGNVTQNEDTSGEQVSPYTR